MVSGLFKQQAHKCLVSNDSSITSRAFVSQLSISCHFYWKENFVHTYSCMNLPTKGLNPGLPHCRQILYRLSHQRNPCMFSVQPLSHVPLFVTPWIAAHQDSLSITNSWSLLKLMSIESMMPSNHLISVITFSSCIQSFPASGSFPVSQFFASGGQSIGVSDMFSIAVFFSFCLYEKSFLSLCSKW